MFLLAVAMSGSELGSVGGFHGSAFVGEAARCWLRAGDAFVSWLEIMGIAPVDRPRPVCENTMRFDVHETCSSKRFRSAVKCATGSCTELEAVDVAVVASLFTLLLCRGAGSKAGRVAANRCFALVLEKLGTVGGGG